MNNVTGVMTWSYVIQVKVLFWCYYINIFWKEQSVKQIIVFQITKKNRFWNIMMIICIGEYNISRHHYQVLITYILFNM